MRRQHPLDKRLGPRTRLVSLASELCGLHAQVMSSAELTALCRLDGLRSEDFAQALWTDRRLVKTWAMRATLHLLPFEEYGHWLRAFEHFRSERGASWFAYYGITPADLERITEAVGKVTRGRMLTREQLAEEIVRLTGLENAHEKLRQGWGSLLKPACYRGYLCFGPNKGQNTQFTHPETELADSDDRFVARKYFAAYGPATERDFARWFAGGTNRVRGLMAAMGEELTAVNIEGVSAWMLRKDLRAAAQAEPVETVRLLPAFDQYVFAAGLRSAQLLPDRFRSRVYKNQGWFAPVLLVDGRMEGVWNFVRRGRFLDVTIQPFVKAAPRVRRAAEEEAERIAQYMQRTLELRWRQH